MIVNIRGTSGTGKSTIVRRIMDRAQDWTRWHHTGRKQPLYYLSKQLNLGVVGHYETPCGGCDTISKQDDIFALVDILANNGFNVLFEGLLMSGDVKRTAPLAQKHDVLVLALDVPIEACLASVNERRRRKNPEAPDVNPKNTISKHKCVARSVERLRAVGVDARWGTREKVEALAVEALGLKGFSNTQESVTE